jgi:hypothetical protein
MFTLRFKASAIRPTTPKQLGAITVRKLMVAGIQARVEQRGCFSDASVDPTDARKATVRRFGRSDRSRLVARADITPDERGRWCATGSVRDLHWSWARIRILGEVEARPDRTITAVGRHVAGSY